MGFCWGFQIFVNSGVMANFHMGNYNIKMERILLLLLLVTAILGQQSPKIKQNKYLFGLDIRDSYSITSQIFDAIKQQQIAKNRPVTIYDPISPRPPQRKQPRNYIMGFVNEATALKPPINFQNQISSIGGLPNVPILMKSSSKKLDVGKTIIFEEQSVNLKQGKEYSLYNIDQKSILDQNGNTIKTDRTNTGQSPSEIPIIYSQFQPTKNNEPSTARTKFEEFSSFVKNKIDQVTRTPNTDMNTNVVENTDNYVNNDGNNDVAGSNKNIRIDNKKFYPFQTQAEQIRLEQEQEIIKIFFSSLFIISILLVIFGYRPQGKRQGDILANKDEEENALK